MDILERPVQIHDNVAGTQATLREEAILKEVKEQMELGDAGLLDEDHWMLVINLGDLETNNGEQAEAASIKTPIHLP